MSISLDTCSRSLFLGDDTLSSLSVDKEYLGVDVTPSAYELTLHPDIATSRYTGEVTIHFTIHKSALSLCLNCDHVKINNVWISYEDGLEELEDINVENTYMDPQNETFLIYPKQKLMPDHYIIYISFNNIISTDNVGLFLDKYVDSNGEVQKYVTTHFEPNFARKVFPCFDNPKFLTVFQLNIVRLEDEETLALSNMAIERETLSYPEEGLVTSHFKKTKPIALHSLAFAIGKFSFIPTSPTPAGLYISVYIRSDFVDRTKRFQELVNTIQTNAEKLFFLKLPLKHLNFLGLPRVFRAMENYGLITLRDEYIQLSESTTTWQQIKTVSLVSQQIAHVWLSNFGKIKVWSDFWLLEGLSGFLGYIFMSLYYKDMNMFWYPILAAVYPCLSIDGYKDTYLIGEQTTFPSYSKLYKTLVFKKSLAIMMMLFFGNLKLFRTCLYKQFAEESQISLEIFYKVATEILPFDPKPVVDTFLNQKGYPLITIRSVYGTTHLLEQSGFVNNQYYPRNESESIYGYKWDIPIYYTCEIEPKTVRFAIMAREHQRAIITHPTGKWILLNHKHVGYFRVNYSKEKWTEFAYLLMKTPEVLEPEDIAGLIEDAFCLTKAGYFHYMIPFNLTVYLHFHPERDILVWRVVSKHLYDVYFHFVDTPAIGSYLLYVRSLLESVYTYCVWDEEQENTTALEKLTRVEILNLGGWARDPRILEEAESCFLRWFNYNYYPYESDLLQIILKYGLQNETDPELWERVLSRYNRTEEQNEDEKDKLWTALASTRSPELIEKLLKAEYPLDWRPPEILRKKLKPLVDNPYALEPLWRFMKIHAIIYLSHSALTRQIFKKYVSKVASRFNTEQKLKEVIMYGRRYPMGKAMKRTVETINNNLHWKEAYYDAASEWLHLYVVCIAEEQEDEVQEESIPELEEEEEEEQDDDNN